MKRTNPARRSDKRARAEPASADLKAAAASGHMKVGEAAKVHRLSALKRVLGSPASTEKTPGNREEECED